jgi:hypothetical protein
MMLETVIMHREIFFSDFRNELFSQICVDVTRQVRFHDT